MAERGRFFWHWLFLIWLASAAWMTLICYGTIESFQFPDADDIMRLVEVRDWLNGQSWFDVSQHRMNPPAGLSMHWSRLVDVPIAALIVLLRPLVNVHIAETVAAACVPMLTLGATMALVAGLTRRWTSPGLALFAAAICPTSVAIWFAMRPMRIDHHGWQIVAGLGIAATLSAVPSRRNAAIAGSCAALWMHVSLEGLPLAAAGGALLATRALTGTRYDAARLSAYLAALTVCGAMLMLLVKGAASFSTLRCDAVSTVHLAAIGIVALGALIGTTAERRSRWTLPLAAALAAIVYRAGTAACAGGPFGHLGPLGYRLWYRSVNEGQPLWRLSPDLIALWAILPIVGLGGALLAWRGSRDVRTRRSLASYCVLLAAAVALGGVVMRAMAFANVLALPGAMVALASLARAARHLPSTSRVALLTLSTIVCSPLAPALASGTLAAGGEERQQIAPATPACGSIGGFAALNALPPSIVIAPPDDGPALIAATHHLAITGPYHRDPGALEDLLRFFTSDSRTARAIARSRHADLLVFCPNARALAVMAGAAPAGLASTIVRRDRPWLKRVDLPGGGALRVYRIQTAADDWRDDRATVAPVDSAAELPRL